MATDTANTTATTTNGCVKWFNNKAGYGFITVNDCETNEERDIFVHHSEIQVQQSQYKYLVQGEYIEFVIAPLVRENRENDIHATSVRGVNGGKLMCETRSERTHNTPRHNYREQSAQTSHQRPQQQQQQRQQRQQRPQLSKDDQSEWMIVPRRRANTVSSKSPHQRREPTIELQ